MATENPVTRFPVEKRATQWRRGVLWYAAVVTKIGFVMRMGIGDLRFEI